MARRQHSSKGLDIQASFDSSLTSSLLLDASVDITEASIDQLLDNEIIKQVPIVKTIAGFVQMGINIQDRLFLKKILSFLQNIEGIPEKERKKIVNDIDDSGKHRVKVGEKLLYILDSCDDHIHAENVAKLFSAMLQGKISYPEYTDAAQIIARISQSELDLFLASHNGYFFNDDAISLVHTGLVYTEVEQVEVEIEKHEPVDHDDPPEYYDATTHGGEVTIKPTSAGDTVYEVLGIGKEKRIQQIRAEHEKKKVKIRDAVISSRSAQS